MIMNLNSDRLQAFIEVYEKQSFSGAAKSLGLTQSALSQRVFKLEDELEATLLVRNPNDIVLTRAGEKLFQFCLNLRSLEQDVFQNLKKETLQSEIRLGVYSSVGDSVILPSIIKLTKNNPKLKLNIKTKEMKDMIKILQNAEVDFIILNYVPQIQGIESVILGEEKNFCFEGVHYKGPELLFLDHDENDQFTMEFLRQQKKKLDLDKVERHFMDDVYGIIFGVEQNLGRGVIPDHLVKNNRKIKICKEFRPMINPIVLCYRKQIYYPNLHKLVVKTLVENGPGYL